MKSHGLETPFPFNHSGYTKDAGNDDVERIVKEALGKLEKNVDSTREKIEAKQADVDAWVEKIGKSIDEQKNARVEDREEFQKSVEQVAKLEKSLDAALETLDALRTGKISTAKSFVRECAELCVEKGFNGGTLMLGTFDAVVDEAKALVTDLPVGTGQTSIAPGGSIVEPYRHPGLELEPHRTLSIRQLMPVTPISSDSYQWVQEKSRTLNPGVQQKQGDAKPESFFDFETKTGAVITIAHWMAASRQALADVRQLESLIRELLTVGLSEEEEDQLLLGTGANGTLTGLLPQAVAYDATTYAVTGDTAIDQIRRAGAQATKARFPTTAIVLNDLEWTKIELTKTSDNAYLFTNPLSGTAPRLWGKTVAISEAMPG